VLCFRIKFPYCDNSFDLSGMLPRPRTPSPSACCGNGCSPCVMDLHEQVYPHGLMSRIVKEWTVGSRISVRGPFGEPPTLLGKESRVVMFCQGTGIVPLLPLLQDLLEEETETMVTMVYSSASVAEMLVLQDLHELCGFWNFQLEIFLSSGEVMVGRVPQRAVESRRLERKDVILKAKQGSRFLVCGSKQYMNQLCVWLTEQGVPDYAVDRF